MVAKVLVSETCGREDSNIYPVCPPRNPRIPQDRDLSHGLVPVNRCPVWTRARIVQSYGVCTDTACMNEGLDGRMLPADGPLGGPSWCDGYGEAELRGSLASKGKICLYGVIVPFFLVWPDAPIT